MTRDERPEVAVVQRPLPPYRRDLFDRLRTELDRRGVDLSLIHGSGSPDRLRWTAERPWVTHVDVRELRLAGRSLTWHPVVRRVADAELVVVQHAARRLETYPLVIVRSIGPPTALWGHGTDRAEDRTAGADALRRWMVRRAHWYFAYTEGSAERAVAQGLPQERVTVLRNTTDTETLARRVAAVDEDDSARLRAELGLVGDRLAVFVGTARQRKRLDHLVAGADRARERVPGFELVVAGWRTESAGHLAASRPWLHLTGPRYGDDLAVLLAAADVLLIPAWVGLAIVDGFAAGLPLVASRSYPHPPEIEYLVDGVNGLFVDDGGDPLRYGDAVADLLEDPSRLARLSEGARRSADGLTLTGMVERFAGGIEGALAAPR